MSIEIIEEVTVVDDQAIVNKPGQGKRRFQWIQGPNLGEVEIFREELVTDGICWIYFESGNRVNKQMKDQFILELARGEEPLAINSSIIDDAFLAKGPSTPTAAPSKISPLQQILEKQKKKELLSINIPISIEIPTKGAFEILVDSFDFDVQSEIIETVIGKITLSSIRDQIIEKVKDEIIAFYKSEE